MIELIPKFNQSPSTPAHFSLPSSKSLVNRYMVLQFLHGHFKYDLPEDQPKDVSQMFQCLSDLYSGAKSLNVGEAGTVARFVLGAAVAKTQNPVVIDGIDRMRQRPIDSLVLALRSWGAKIEFLDQDGHFPLMVSPSVLTYNDILLQEHASSQFISSLLILSTLAEKTVTISIHPDQSSISYIRMTTDLINSLGGNITWRKENHWQITVEPRPLHFPTSFLPESDWSAAHYWLAASACTTPNFSFRGLHDKSYQGDSTPILKELYPTFHSSGEVLLKSEKPIEPTWPKTLDFSNQPDLAPTYALLAAILGVDQLDLTGLKSLAVKESDRIAVMQEHLQQLNVTLNQVDTNRWTLIAKQRTWPSVFHVDPHNDHRMAMSMALVGLLVRTKVSHPECVTKSYPQFWNHLSQLAVNIVHHE